jgi:hypothetical protein
MYEGRQEVPIVLVGKREEKPNMKDPSVAGMIILK